MAAQHDPRSADIYITLMRWMEGKPPSGATAYASGQGLYLSIRVPALAPAGFSEVPLDPSAPTLRLLRFRLGKGMGGTAWADSMDREGVRIHYDPNWEAYMKIDELLAEGDVPIASQPEAQALVDKAKAEVK
jgi:hypothetical protein